MILFRKNKYLLLVIIGSVFLTNAFPVFAQLAGLSEGQSVRITIDGQLTPLKGVVTRIRSDSIWVRDSRATWGISLLQAANNTTQNGFYVIPNIKFEADRKDPSVLKCAFVLARWYNNQNSLTDIKGNTGHDLANTHKNIKLLVSR